MKNKNISIEYENGVPIKFITESTEDLTLPRFGFEKEEEAEFVVAMAKLLKAHEVKDLRFEIIKCTPFVFRLLNIKNEWTV